MGDRAMGDPGAAGDRRREVVIATRGSALALWQANAVADMLRAQGAADVRLEVLSTVGDRVLDTALGAIGDKGIFTKELEQALLDGRAHIAVHSLKDMQTRLPEGLTLGAIGRRHAAEDALVAPAGTTLASLPHGAVVATGSVRRSAQLLAMRPDLTIVDVRGNVGTRLAKLRDNGWHGMILARAGLERLGLGDAIAEVIPVTTMIPAVGQGALGIECRADDAATLALLATIDHAPTRIATAAERAALLELDGGCNAPIGAYAIVDEANERIDIIGFIADTDGRGVMRANVSGTVDDPVALGRRLAAALVKNSK